MGRCIAFPVLFICANRNITEYLCTELERRSDPFSKGRNFNCLVHHRVCGDGRKFVISLKPKIKITIWIQALDRFAQKTF